MNIVDKDIIKLTLALANPADQMTAHEVNQLAQYAVDLVNEVYKRTRKSHQREERIRMIKIVAGIVTNMGLTALEADPVNVTDMAGMFYQEFVDRDMYL